VAGIDASQAALEGVDPNIKDRARDSIKSAPERMTSKKGTSSIAYLQIQWLAGFIKGAPELKGLPAGEGRSYVQLLAGSPFL
jgi:hypothetical protein